MKIEKGIPIPPPQKGMGRPRSDLGKTVRALDIGDSILLDTENEADRARYVAKYLGYKVCRRKVEDGWRMWRKE